MLTNISLKAFPIGGILQILKIAWHMNVMMGQVSSRRRLVLQSVIKVLHTTTVINLFLQHQLNKTVFYFDYQIRLR